MIMKILKQKHYGDIEVDDREVDIIEICNYQGRETNIIQVERENIQQLIDMLFCALSNNSI